MNNIATQPSARALPRVREREILRLAAVITGDNAADAALAARQEVLRWAAKQVGDALPDYDAQFRQYRVRIDANLKDQGREALIELAKRSRASFGKAG